MLGLILGALAVVGIIIAVVVSIANTPDNLRGFYGGMFWTIAIVAIIGLAAVATVGLL